MTTATSTRRPRPQRSALESLLSIALLLEAVLLFFVALALFALKVLPAGLAFGLGLGMIVLLILDGRLVRYAWGRWLGWVLQAFILGSGFLLPLMFFIGAAFLGIWIYCFITGRRLDAAKAAYLAANPADPNLTDRSLDPNPTLDPKESA